MNKMYQMKDITYDLRDSNILCQPKLNKITYGKSILAITEHTSQTCFQNNIKQCTTLDNFKRMLKVWEGRKINIVRVMF